MKRLYHVGVVLVICYVISFGPMLFICTSLGVHKFSGVAKAVYVIYFPHFYLAKCSHLYYDYMYYVTSGSRSPIGGSGSHEAYSNKFWVIYGYYAK